MRVSMLLKHFQNLLERIKTFGIKVIIVAPGSISTPIWQTVKKQKEQNKFGKTKYSIPFKEF